MKVVLTKAATRANALALVGFLGMLACLGVLAYVAEQAGSAQRWERHTFEVLMNTRNLEIALRDAEIDQHGFLLTGEASLLASYGEALGRAVTREGNLRRLTADNATQQARLANLLPLVGQKLDQFGKTIELQRAADPEAALKRVRADLTTPLTAQINAGLATFASEERQLLAARLAEVDRIHSLAFWFVLTVAVSGAGALLIAIRLLRRTVHRALAAEAAQRTLALQLKSSFESISQGVAVFDVERRLVRWNDCFTVVLGLPRVSVHEGTTYATMSECLAKTAGAELLEPETLLRSVDQDGSAREPIVYERCLPASDRSLEVRRTPMPDGGFVLTVTDTSKRRRAEILQRESQKLQAIGQLTGGVAHDFNNLLQGITSCLESIRDSDPAAEVQEYARIALNSAARGSYLTHHLLSYARKQVLQPKRLLVGQLLEDMRTLLARTLGPRINVVVALRDPIPAIEVDPNHLQTALLNLGINAGYAMPDGGTLTFEASIDASVEPVAVIAVVDTGIGMERETLERACEPFFTTKGANGTGLGLSMVQGFAQQSGGTVRITSFPGRGTRVELRLPAALAAEPSSASEAAVQRPAAARVLLVDDVSDVLSTTAAFLERGGMQVLSAPHAEQALAHLSLGDRFDVLITDYALPGLNGIELIDRARALQPDLPAIIITGFAEVELPADTRQVEVLSKPFKLRDLMVALRRMMECRRVMPSGVNGSWESRSGPPSRASDEQFANLRALAS